MEIEDVSGADERGGLGSACAVRPPRPFAKDMADPDSRRRMTKADFHELKTDISQPS